MIPQPEAAERSAEEYLAGRRSMVENQLRRRGIEDFAVLQVMASVPRHEFVPPEFRYRAYEDVPLPIGEGQTISQPYMVASIAAALRLTGGERVLEVGAGCGYQAAILSSLTKEIFAIEYRSDLAAAAAERLKRLGYANVHIHCGDGTLGLSEFATFDAIVISAAAPAARPPSSRNFPRPAAWLYQLATSRIRNCSLSFASMVRFERSLWNLAASCRSSAPTVGRNDRLR